MSSFIDLMANDVWTDADILRRTESLIRAEFSAEAETILNRKAMGMALGTYQPTPEEVADLARYQVTVEEARLAGVAARADMALLAVVMGMEQAARRLAQPELPEEDPGYAEDQAERVAAQAIMDAASPEAAALFEARKPPTQPEPELEAPQEGEGDAKPSE